MAFTVIGTLVDTMPEALLLTELPQHCDVFKTWHGTWQVFRLFCSDGKPVIAFAAADGTTDHLGSQRPPTEPLEKIRASLRRRLAAIAAGLHMRDDFLCCLQNEYPELRWTYAGLLGFLLGGEVLTTVGASLFLHIEFSWAALVSLLASILSLLVSTRCTMSAVGEKCLHAPPAPAPQAAATGGKLVDFLIPGPFTLVRLLLVVPVWPLAVVYAEASTFWPFSLLDDDWDHSQSRSDDALWVNPLDWLRIVSPAPGRSNTVIMGVEVSYLAWAIAPHLVWTLVVGAWTALSGSWYVIRWYFGYERTGGAVDWARHFADQDSAFHSLTRRLQGALGLGFTMAVAREKTVLFFSLVLLTVALTLAVDGGGDTCAEQEWIFVFAVWAWWAVMLVGHTARRKNFFRTAVVASPYPIIS